MRIQTGQGVAEAVKAAIAPESERELQRTSVSIATEGNWLMLRIRADDTTALRAAVNSYTRWIQVAIDTANLAEQ